MHNLRLKKIKTIIFIAVAMSAFVMVIGIFKFKNNFFLSRNYFKMEIRFLETKIRYAFYNSQDIPESKQKNEIKAESVPVLLYHGVIEDSAWKPDEVNISLTDFRNQMFALKRAGYQSISLKDFYAFMQEEKKLPEKSVLITFDDGRSDSYYPIDPILHALDYNAVMFIITGRSLNSNTIGAFHLSETELKEMISGGRWEIGSHTQNGHNLEKIEANGNKGHFLSDKLWLDSENRLESDEEFLLRIKHDLSGSKADIQKRLGVEVLGFAYPFGDYGHNTQNNPDSQRILTETVNNIFYLSFKQSAESEFPVNYPGKNFRLIKRVNVGSDVSSKQLVSILNGTQKKNLPYSDSFSQDRGWLTGWGKSQLEKGLLLTGASESEDSSLTFLNGTFAWTDYTMSANARIIKGNSFSVVARYISGNNYASCDISNLGVSLTERVGGQEKIISESTQELALSPGMDIPIGMSAMGNTVSCIVQGKIVATGKLSENLSHGGIGFKTWDNSINNSSILVSNLIAK